MSDSSTGTGAPRFSIVIPTHERRETVVRNVRALDRQTFRDFEAIVVVDGSTDGTAAALRELDVSFPLTVVEQPNRGVAEARIAGAAAAGGEILLFVDDDMEADREMLAEHQRSHSEGYDYVLGDLPLHPASPRNLLSWGVGYWANSRRERLEAAGNELGLEDLLTGQMSVSRRAFEQVGGFDTSFTREDGLVPSGDVDFGYRILKGGFRAAFNPKAISYQYYDVDPGDYLRRAFDIGSSEQELVIKHPEQAQKLERAPAFHTRRSRWTFGALVAAPAALIRPLRGVVVRIVRGGRQDERLRRLFFALRTLEYQRGARAARRAHSTCEAVVLAYHAVGDLTGDPLQEYAVPPERLAEQLDDFTRRGHTFISLGTLLRALAGEEQLPPMAVLVTFDDAYVDLLRDGCPVLEERGVPAVTFAVAGSLGGVNDWRREGARELPLLGAEGLRELVGRGVEVGSHCMTHRQLPKVPAEELERELQGSAEALEELGLPRPRALAYPHGEWSNEVAAAAHRAGYEAAFTVEAGRVERSRNRYALPRIEVLASDTPKTIRVKIATAGWPDKLRTRLLRRLGTRP
ncbi:MAG TPA: polysaccharide deacetylase family protein [Solirubrobacterales bacterium]|nr:polysaccharide deacetylase family protein [Solirubrobacterales bacterium]